MLNSNQFIQTFIAGSYDGVITFDHNLLITAHNSVILDYFNLADKELVGKSILHILPFLNEIVSQLKEVLKGQSFSFKNKSFRTTESPVKIYWNGNFLPIKDNEGSTIGGMAIFRKLAAKELDNDSITNKRLKDALKAYTFANDRLHCIINSSQDLIVALDTKFRFILFNNGYKRYFEQYTGKKINLGVNMLDCLAHMPVESQKIKQAWEDVLNGQQKQTLEEITDAQGNTRYVELNFSLVKDREDNVIGASQIIRDVTERMLNQELLLASERKLAKVFQQAQVGFVLIDLETNKFTQANKAFYKVFGYTPNNIRELTTQDITHPDDFLAEQALMRKLWSGEIEGYDIEKRMLTKDGKEIWVSVSATLLNDSNNKPEFGLGIIEDITERKLAQEQLQETLKTLEERNFELDQFVYRTSHDLRSPLNSILGMVNLMKLDSDEQMLPEYINRIEGRINRLDDFINSMLSYSRNSRAELKNEKVDYRDIIEQCLEDLKYYKGFEDVKIDLEISGENNEFFSDVLRNKIVCNNLISNAIKYQDFDKQVRLLKIKVQIDSEKTCLCFIDNGIGIKPEYLQNISKMFFRATEEAEGTGLGMYIVKQTIDKLGGTISIHSEGHQKGVEVRVEIPNQKSVVFHQSTAAGE
jgi:PAS domain S-box-containing protein